MKKNNVLNKIGLKSTPSRCAILDVLRQSSCPLAAEDIFIKLKEVGVSINLSTVYRTLDALTEKNVLEKVSVLGDGRMLYEYTDNAHRHYLVCKMCKKMLTIDCCPLSTYEKTLEDKTKFTISEHQLNIYGFCPQCKEKGIK